MLGLCFPVFAAGNVAALAGWAVAKSKRAIMPLAGLLSCLSDLSAYCPANIPQPAPKGCLKVLSYNVKNFSHNAAYTLNAESIADYILSSEADIVCLQEGGSSKGWDDLEKKLRKRYPYIETISQSATASVLRCISRYPITGHKALPIKSDKNGVGIFNVAFGRDDTIRVINCHLQSDNLTKADRENYKSLVRGEQQGEAKTVLSLLKKLSKAAQIRGPQVDSIMKDIKGNGNSPIILCGDFNDTPISYSRREISTALTDVYKACGFGPGFSFNSDGMFVRIDYVFCSKHWKPYDATVDRSIKCSDHYPINALLKRTAE